MLRTISFVILALAAGVFPVGAQTSAVDQPAEAPSVKLKGLDGKLYDTSVMRGEVVVASFGATWCVPCVWELKAVEELVEEYKGKPVRFLWISIEPRQRTSDALLRNYAKTYRLTVPVLRDDDGTTFSQFSESRRIPLVVFFDTDGQFSAPSHRGMASDPIQYKQMVRRRVDALLSAGAKKPEAETK